MASSVAGHSVSVWCEDSYIDWVAAENYLKSSELDGFTFQGQTTVWLSPYVCQNLHHLLTSGLGYQAVDPLWSARAIETLIHEAVHQRGISDEAQTDCLAMAEVERYAVGSFGFPATVAKATSKTVVGFTKVKGGKTGLPDWRSGYAALMCGRRRGVCASARWRSASAASSGRA